MTGTEGHERRQAQRIPEHVKVSYRVIQDEAAAPKMVAAETINMSTSGLCLRSPEPLDSDVHLALELSLEGKTDVVVAFGRVVWCDRDGENYRVGICYSWLREQDRKSLQVIADYVDGRSES